MNPLSNVRLINELNKKEVRLGINEKASWHNEYKDSAWIFVGGLSYELTEGDVVCVFSQYGEVVNINLIRDKATGKSKGYCFLCYEDQRSTVLAVDNLNGIKLSNRVVRVDHVANYKVPKDFADTDPLVKALRDEGCGPSVVKKPVDDVIEIVDEGKTMPKVEKITPKKASSREDERRHSRDNIRIKKEKNDVEFDKHNDRGRKRNENDSRMSRRGQSRSESGSPARNNNKLHKSKRNRSKSDSGSPARNDSKSHKSKRNRSKSNSGSPARNDSKSHKSKRKQSRSESGSPARNDSKTRKSKQKQSRSESGSPARNDSKTRKSKRNRSKSESRSPAQNDSKSHKSRRNRSRSDSGSPARNNAHKRQDHSANRQNRRRSRSRSKSPGFDRHDRKERGAFESTKSSHHKRNHHSESSRHYKRT